MGNGTKRSIVARPTPSTPGHAATELVPRLAHPKCCGAAVPTYRCSGGYNLGGQPGPVQGTSLGGPHHPVTSARSIGPRSSTSSQEDGGKMAQCRSIPLQTQTGQRPFQGISITRKGLRFCLSAYSLSEMLAILGGIGLLVCSLLDMGTCALYLAFTATGCNNPTSTPYSVVAVQYLNQKRLVFLCPFSFLIRLCPSVCTPCFKPALRC